MKAIDRLLDKEAARGYLDAWKGSLSQKKDRKKSDEKRPFLVFLLGSSWFALSVFKIGEIVLEKKVHCVPHLSGGVFRGIANISGHIVPCVSLYALLGEKEKEDLSCFRKMIVLEKNQKRWAFCVDKIEGIHSLPGTEGKNLKEKMFGVCVDWEGKELNCLNEERLFKAFTRRLDNGNG